MSRDRVRTFTPQSLTNTTNECFMSSESLMKHFLATHYYHMTVIRVENIFIDDF